MGAPLNTSWSREDLDRWFEQVHHELRKIAASERRRVAGAPGAPGTTSLLHLAYERLAGQDELTLESPKHFFAMAAKTMRHILVDRARAATALKRGAGQRPASLTDVEPWLVGRFSDEHELSLLLDLERAIDALAERDEELVRLVEHHIHLGMTLEEYAELIGVSHSTIKRRWRLARAHLSRVLGAERAGSLDA